MLVAIRVALPGRGVVLVRGRRGPAGVDELGRALVAHPGRFPPRALRKIFEGPSFSGGRVPLPVLVRVRQGAAWTNREERDGGA